METKFIERLWQRDPTLWGGDDKAQAEIRDRLGWLDAPHWAAEHAGEMEAFATEVRAAGFTHALLLGMGGSSLCPEVFRQVFGGRTEGLKLHVLDSTDPDQIRAIENAIDPEHTLILVTSKSGTTVEVTSFFKYFSSKIHEPTQYVAITDPGTPLERLGREKGFRHVFLNPADIGGRYSALSYFGLVPAALMGMDIHRLLRETEKMVELCKLSDEGKNPGFALGKKIGEAALAGKDKLVLETSPELSSIGLWVEQLVGESTGKEGKGIVPVMQKSGSGPGKDRISVSIDLKDAYEIGAEFFRWEFATSYASYLMKVNPFDEPNVQEAKDLTKQVLMKFQKGEAAPEEPFLTDSGVSLFGDTELRGSYGSSTPSAVIEKHISRAKAGDYVAILAFVAPTTEYEAELQALSKAISTKTGCVVTYGFGPRYLHSTGQLHKGGSANVLFLEITHEPTQDISVAGETFTFGTLERAQALGDFMALSKRGRRILRVHLKKSIQEGFKLLRSSLS